HHHDLHSNPTRRSSDLPAGGLEPGPALGFGPEPVQQTRYVQSLIPPSTILPFVAFRQRRRVVARDTRVESQISGLRGPIGQVPRSEEHTSELQSRENLV